MDSGFCGPIVPRCEKIRQHDSGPNTTACLKALYLLTTILQNVSREDRLCRRRCIPQRPVTLSFRAVQRDKSLTDSYTALNAPLRPASADNPFLSLHLNAES